MASKDCDQDSLAVSLANNHLAVLLYKLLAQEDGNVFFSPFSISTALAMLFCGAEHETSKEMRNILGYDVAGIRDDQLKYSYRLLLTDLSSNQESYTLASANSVLSHNQFSVKDEFKILLETYFKASFREVDFLNGSAKVVREINEWVRDKTQNMIPNLLQSLNPNTVMVLVNAVYFKGLWLNQFNSQSTSLRGFYNNGVKDDVKQVDMMHLKETFRYAEKDSFKALQLPYRGDDISMLILLPNDINGLVALEDSLNPTFIQDLMGGMRKVKVKVSLPKFRMEYSKSLKQQFQSLGMSRAFSPGAHFGGISNSKNIFVSDVIHKAVLVVNEEGTEASAATAVIMCKRAIMRIPEFIVDHPFLFFILNSRNNLVLFMGRVNEL